MFLRRLPPPPRRFQNGARPAWSAPIERPVAIALLSGGLDSATAAALAIEAGYRVIGLSFDYGQRHRRELEAARAVAAALGLEEHHVIAVNLAAWGGSALTDTAIPVPTGGVQEGGIPRTYVPGRNTVFIALGLSLAEARGAERVVLGVNAVDYSGYPDCRPDYLAAFQTLADLASKAGREGHGARLWAPLVRMEQDGDRAAGPAAGGADRRHLELLRRRRASLRRLRQLPHPRCRP